MFQQWAMTVIFIFLGMGLYLSLVQFALAFDRSASNEIQILVFVLFSAFNLVVKTLYKMLGHRLDMGKRGSVLLFYLAELMCALFYFSFYRLLFEAVSGYVQFFALQALHVCLEWVTYPMMASSSWLHIVDQSPNWARAFLEVMPKLSKRERACYLTNAFGIRIMCFIYTSIGFITYKTFIVLGWNAKQFGHSGDMLAVELWQLSLFVLLASVVEGLNAWIMNITFFVPKKLNLLVFMSSLFKHGRPHEFQLFTAVVANILLLQIFLPFVSLDYESDHSGTTPVAVLIAVVSVCLIILTGSVFKSIFQSVPVPEDRQQQKQKEERTKNPVASGALGEF